MNRRSIGLAQTVVALLIGQIVEDVYVDRQRERPGPHHRAVGR